jgi:hypothetical protein
MSRLETLAGVERRNGENDLAPDRSTMRAGTTRPATTE